MGTRFFCRICRNAEVAASCMSVWAKWRTSWKAQIQWEFCLQGGRGVPWAIRLLDLSYTIQRYSVQSKPFSKETIWHKVPTMWNLQQKKEKSTKLATENANERPSMKLNYGSSNLMYQWGSSWRNRLQMDPSSITYNIQTGGLPITSKHRDMIATEICLLQTFYSHKINFKTCLLTEFWFFAINRK